MEIKMMCPKCLGRSFTQIESNDTFICDACNEYLSVAEMICASDYYVYRFVNDDWGVPFYVGKGSHSRYISLKGRSQHIQSICSNFKWHTEIIKYFSVEKESYEYEDMIKKEYKKLGYPIIDGEANIIHKMNQRVGIEKAKSEGKYKGGKRKRVTGFEEGYKRYKSREVSKTGLARELHISRPTLDKLIKEYEAPMDNN